MMNCRKAPIICLMVLSSAIFSVYMVFFNHGPPEEILSANRRNFGDNRMKTDDTVEDSGSISKDMDNDLFVESLKKWKDFVESNNYVSIGDIYDSCEEGERILVGTVILLKDKKLGGVKSRSFINVTFEDEYTGGEFYLDVKYNNQNLYDNHWEVCTLDDEEEDRMIFCPYKANSVHSWVKDRKVPNYLPKGRYYAKGWITNQNGDTVICAISDFVM